ncbi:hypothetical protein M0R88_10310 [Halorussus gelatinilyticus]|uniref:DOD-type homing endonuclease domain-containing protein n=1 Tax=Halorussus gelatinilyticus TaxID=2937524 RepID=A0A8U0IF39_9EURY|nr:hypothetical protein [Halorussus gelatinilyticus]UPV98923.1 hypothetical protein M0R88_10310 [Halorussus gelatinilyticus]
MTEDVERQLTKRNTQRTPESSTKKKRACKLAGGGFTAEAEILTTTGLTTVTDLSTGQKVYALDPISRIIKPKPVTAVRTVPFDGQLITIEARRVDIQVAPDHRIPYRTKSDSRIRFKRAGNLKQKSYYKFINSWQSLPRKRLETVDITDFLDEYEICVSYDGHGHTFRAALPDGCEPIRNNGHTGYHFDAQTFKEHQSVIEALADEITIRSGPNHHRRPYRFDGDDFIQFLGWFITEGSVYWSSSSDTAQVKIAQENERHRQSIASLFERMQLDFHSNDRRFEMGSKVFGRLLENHCGAGSHNKHLPAFVWNLSQKQQRLLLEVLIAGDGNDRQTYYTASERLANDILQLCLELGIKPRYTVRKGIWQIYVREVNDGFQSAVHLGREEATQDLYRLTVEDYNVVMAGRNGKFQWVGVSNVA